MFTSRNIHFAILGIIIGAASGYMLAFYQVQASMPRTAAAAGSNLPQGHPNVNNDQLLAMFKEALQKNPNDITLMTRYANLLFDLGRYSEVKKRLSAEGRGRGPHYNNVSCACYELATPFAPTTFHFALNVLACAQR